MKHGLSVLLLFALIGMQPVSAIAPANIGTSHAKSAGPFEPISEMASAAALDRALANAAKAKRPLLVVFGANWCHDSLALASLIELDPLRGAYDVVSIDVGRPQTGAGRNLALARRFGIENLKSTPAMVAIGPDGRPRNNAADAVRWRNAEKLGAREFGKWLTRYVPERNAP